MNNLWQKINNDLISAMKSKQKLELAVLRMVFAAMKNKKIALGNKEDLTDEQVLEVVKSEAKKRKDSVAEYTRGNRQDLVDKELSEIKIIEKYLPEQMSKEDVEMVVKEVIESLGEVSMKDFGNIMSQVMAKLKGQADGSVVSVAVKEAVKCGKGAKRHTYAHS